MFVRLVKPVRRRIREARECFACGEGSQIKSNGVGCEKCPLGKERPRTMSNCSTCVKGYVATSRGKAYCEICPAGTFAANETTCIGCPAGSYCREGSSEPSPCPEGTYCPKGSENPISVKAGKYTNAHRTNTSAAASPDSTASMANASSVLNIRLETHPASRRPNATANVQGD